MNLNQAPILSVETATPVCSVALRLPDGTLYEERAEGKGGHSELTFVFIRKLLDDAGICVRDLGAVLVSGGPGSYTGLRIGGSAVKGLLFQSGVPLYAYNTLAGIALGAAHAAMKCYSNAMSGGRNTGKSHSNELSGSTISDSLKSRGRDEKESEVPEMGLIIDAVIDARRNHLYHQTWHYSKNGLTPESGLVALELEVVLEWWTSGRMLAGTGSERMLRLAESRGIRIAGLSPFAGTEIISAASILEYIAGDPERHSEASKQKRPMVKGYGMKLIQKVDPSGFEPDYYSGL